MSPATKTAVLAAFFFTMALAPVLEAAAALPGVDVVADVPLLESDGMPCVEARFGDGPAVLFAIDTGDVNCALDTGAAKAAALTLTALPPPMPAGLFKATVPVLHIGPLVLKDQVALVMDFAKNQVPSKLAGTLAYTAFNDRILQIDFVEKRVRISGVLTQRVALPGPSDTFSLITFGDKGPPIVVAKGFELGGAPLTAQLDTMYTGSLLIYSRSVAKLGQLDASKAAVGVFFPFTDGGVTMKTAAAPRESFRGTDLGGEKAQVYFPTPGVHEPEGLFDATVGLALLKNTVLTLDFYDGTLSVEVPGTKVSSRPFNPTLAQVIVR
jgi:hypothetical protein